MKDIALYGHLTIDTITDGDTEKKTLGSMANVWKALLELDATLDVGLSPIDVGQALIYIDKPAAQKILQGKSEFGSASGQDDEF